MRWKATVGLCAVAVAVAAWLLHMKWQSVLIPAAIEGENGWKAKLMHLAATAMNEADPVLSAIGIPIWVMRWVANRLLNVLRTGLPMNSGSDELTEVHFDVFDGVPVKVYRSKAAASVKDTPALVYFHGGGFVWLSPEFNDAFSRHIVEELGFVVIAADYRLAPEHPFPAGFEDCLAVTEYVLREHSHLGIDPKRVLVGGDSAGGNLAAAVAGQLKKRLKMQVLIYPMLQAFDFLTPSYVDNWRPFMISPEFIATCWLRYGNFTLDYLPTFLTNNHLHHSLRASKYARCVHSDLIPAHLGVTDRQTLRMAVPHGDAEVSAAVHRTVLDPRYAPLMADSLDDYPDAYIVTAQYDVLRDDGVMYAHRLMEAKNVVVKLEHYGDGFHGFLALMKDPLKMPVAQAALKNMAIIAESYTASWRRGHMVSMVSSASLPTEGICQPAHEVLGFFGVAGTAGFDAWTTLLL